MVPSFTFAATANAVAMTGATPVFADIEPATFCLDPDAVAAAVTSRTAAIIPVHLYGHPAPWDGLADVAERHGLLLLEDAAQAHAASYDGTPVGALGDIAAFSFYATKNMTTGEGGMVVCRDEATARTRAAAAQPGHGAALPQRDRRPEQPDDRPRGGHGPGPAASARRLERASDEAVAATYDEQLAGVVTTPVVAPKAEPVWHQYTVRSRDRDSLAARLDAQGNRQRRLLPRPDPPAAGVRPGPGPA